MDPKHLLLPNRPPGDRSIYDEVFVQNVYERYYTIGPTDLVIDVGAHVGFFAWKAAQAARYVTCFEPSADNFGALAQNTADLTNVRRYNVALGSYTHVADLWYAPGNTGGHSLYKNLVNRHDRSEKVKVVRLDDLLISNVTFMKIDAENSEAEIIKGSYGLISRFRPNMAIEIHSESVHKEVEALLSPLGYELISKGSGYCSMLYAVPR